MQQFLHCEHLLHKVKKAAVHQSSLQHGHGLQPATQHALLTASEQACSVFLSSACISMQGAEQLAMVWCIGRAHICRKHLVLCA